MRKYLMLVLLACALPLAGCATPGGGGGPVSIPRVDPAVVEQVQKLATDVCGFVPTVSTVLSVITTFTGGGAIVDMIGNVANGICGAVTARGARRGMTPKYRGVVIRGNFVR